MPSDGLGPILSLWRLLGIGGNGVVEGGSDMDRLGRRILTLDPTIEKQTYGSTYGTEHRRSLPDVPEVRAPVAALEEAAEFENNDDARARRPAATALLVRIVRCATAAVAAYVR
ncbi:hypothetical protein DL764_000513 [Monosporascus ibericus]|uniref:Uncharacterized protein n=1 Tax=Monosporascus ibericus TaxID=155417 RepID=A0A4Q4TYJ8_9PEZI|nr:hypothetical protein DL764_000513 [Monosporascus ibericus]